MAKIKTTVTREPVTTITKEPVTTITKEPVTTVTLEPAPVQPVVVAPMEITPPPAPMPVALESVDQTKATKNANGQYTVCEFGECRDGTAYSAGVDKRDIGYVNNVLSTGVANGNVADSYARLRARAANNQIAATNAMNREEIQKAFGSRDYTDRVNRYLEQNGGDRAGAAALAIKDAVGSGIADQLLMPQVTQATENAVGIANNRAALQGNDATVSATGMPRVLARGADAVNYSINDVVTSESIPSASAADAAIAVSAVNQPLEKTIANIGQRQKVDDKFNIISAKTDGSIALQAAKTDTAKVKANAVIEAQKLKNQGASLHDKATEQIANVNGKYKLEVATKNGTLRLEDSRLKSLSALQLANIRAATSKEVALERTKSALVANEKKTGNPVAPPVAPPIAPPITQ